nr:tetratricopeptide repeat protein [Pukyongiella litopenaei]
MLGLAAAGFSGAAAAGCPPAPDHGAALAGLLEQARRAGTEAEAQRLVPDMWALWADAPDDHAQALLERGMTNRSGYNFLGALQAFDALIAYCPDYAEGYNQRAFVNYLRQDFSRALPDLDRAVALSPDHVAAIAGRALTLLALGRTGAARRDLDRALALNPWLPERRLVAPGGPLAPEEHDI